MVLVAAEVLSRANEESHLTGATAGAVRGYRITPNFAIAYMRYCQGLAWAFHSYQSETHLRVVVALTALIFIAASDPRTKCPALT